MVESTPDEAGQVALTGEVIEQRTPDQWAQVIRADLSRAIEGIIAAGLHLREAKEACPGLGTWADWERWLKSDVKISSGSASKLMAIAEHPTFAELSTWKELPPNWTTLYELSRLDPPWLERAISNGRVHPELDTRKAHELVVEYKQLAAEVAFDVRHGDFREVLADLEPGSIDAVITDPPYPAEFLPLFGIRYGNEQDGLSDFQEEGLSEFAAKWLKPGGICAVMVGQSYLPEVMERLSSRLTYHWTLAYLTPGGQAVQLFARKVNTFWKPVLLYTNGDADLEWFGDVARSDVNDNDKRHHHWGQSESGMADLIKRLTRAGQRVCDPFMGAATTGVAAISIGRSFVGCDVNADHVQTAEQRLQEAVYERL